MEIRARVTGVYVGRWEAAASPPAPSDSTRLQDAFTPSGAADPASQPLPPPPVLKRPVLFVPGFNSHKPIFSKMLAYLEGGDPPVNAFGGRYDAARPAPLDPDGKLFVMKFSKSSQSAADNERELAAALRAVCRATGSDRVDVVTHSMGALDTRLYLEDGGRHVGRLIMVSPPNHGSIEADAELYLREKWHVPSDPDVINALDDLRVDDVKSDGEPNNPFLHDLNADWSEERARTDGATVIMGGGVPTANPDGSVTTMGDGAVTWDSAALPGVVLQTYDGTMSDLHFRILRDPRVVGEVGRMLGDHDEFLLSPGSLPVKNS